MESGTVDFAGLSGEMVLDENQAKVMINTQDGHLAAPDIYRAPLNWKELSAQFNINLNQAGSKVMLNSFWCDCIDFDLQLWMDLRLSEVNSMILNSRLSDVKVTQLWKYWPHNVWKEKSMYGKTFMGIERSTFLIAGDGTLLQEWRKVRVKDHVEAVLEAVKSL